MLYYELGSIGMKAYDTVKTHPHPGGKQYVSEQHGGDATPAQLENSPTNLCSIGEAAGKEG